MTFSHAYLPLGLLLAVLVGALIFGGMQADAPPTTADDLSFSATASQEVSVRLDSGVLIMLHIKVCPDKDRLHCFGSGAANPETRDTVTVFDLVSKDCEPRFGVIIRRGTESTYYRVSTKLEEEACNNQNNYIELRRLLISTPNLFTQ